MKVETVYYMKELSRFKKGQDFSGMDAGNQLFFKIKRPLKFVTAETTVSVSYVLLPTRRQKYLNVKGSSMYSVLKEVDRIIMEPDEVQLSDIVYMALAAFSEIKDQYRQGAGRKKQERNHDN